MLFEVTVTTNDEYDAIDFRYYHEHQKWINAQPSEFKKFSYAKNILNLLTQ